MQEVKDLLVQATSQKELIDLFRDDIIPKSDQTLRVSMSAYEVGKTDFLQLIDNWRQLLRFQIAYQRLESQLQQTIASLDRVVGGQLPLEAAAPTSETPGTGRRNPRNCPPCRQVPIDFCRQSRSSRIVFWQRKERNVVFKNIRLGCG